MNFYHCLKTIFKQLTGFLCWSKLQVKIFHNCQKFVSVSSLLHLFHLRCQKFLNSSENVRQLETSQKDMKFKSLQPSIHFLDIYKYFRRKILNLRGYMKITSLELHSLWLRRMVQNEQILLSKYLRRLPSYKSWLDYFDTRMNGINSVTKTDCSFVRLPAVWRSCQLPFHDPGTRKMKCHWTFSHDKRVPIPRFSHNTTVSQSFFPPTDFFIVPTTTE